MFEKLVRDRIPELFPEHDYRLAAEDEWPDLLRAKLGEETREYLTSGAPEELADILEVLYALARRHDLDPAGLERLRQAKAAERGALAEGFVLRDVPVRHSVRALLLDGSDLVLFRRVRAGREPYWITPGGQVEPVDDDLDATLRRELDEELGATIGPALPLVTLTAPGTRYNVFACRLKSLDLSLRSGPEFADPETGSHEIERIPFTAAAIGALNLLPIELAAYLADNARIIPALLDVFTAGERYRPIVDVHVLLLDGDPSGDPGTNPSDGLSAGPDGGPGGGPGRGKVLLGKRQGTGYADGEWQIMPSGHLEDGESVHDTAIREAREELGIELSAADLETVHVMHHRNPGGTARIGMFFAARRWHGEPVNAEPGKCAALAWHSLDDLPEGLVPYSAAGIRALREGRPFSLHGWHTPDPDELAAEAARAGYQEMSVTVLAHRDDTVLVLHDEETDRLPTTPVRQGEPLTAAVARILPGQAVFIGAEDYVSRAGLPARRFAFAVGCGDDAPTPEDGLWATPDSPLRLTATDRRLIADRVPGHAGTPVTST
jgi:8-oxo-dGTP pyrophosphatase MutT (NUDIX family)/predicted house-cleaning noncanonical NTP pyrophosphatase (MazG superfamily)